MRKEVFALMFFVLMSFVLTSGVLAVGNETNQTSGLDKVNVAYTCLENQIKDKDLGLQDAVFATMALGGQDDLIDEIEHERNGNCWPSPTCTLRETAQVVLAYNQAGKSNSEITDWLESRAKVADDLTWYLEIDVSNHVASDCTVRYNGNKYDFKIKDDMTLSGSAGSCLKKSSSGYWLEITDACVGDEEEFEVSCDEDFITTLIYEKSLGGTIFVSSDTHSASSLGTTKEQVSAKCFATGSKCDYEGTLWATLALDKKGKDVSEYLPYLIALSSDNQKYFPSSFLYILAGGDDQYTEITQNQKQGKFWELVSSPYNRFYDTSLGLLGLAGTSAEERTNAQNYLIGIQTTEGCWNNNNIRDTGFILYSGWGKTAKSGGSSVGTSCTGAGNYCVPRYACLEASGLVMGEYDCSNFGDSCCSVNVIEQTCAEKSGVICGSGETCKGSTTSSLDGTCCLDVCQITQQANSCEILGGICSVSCGSGTKEASNSCDLSGEKCCVQDNTTGSSIWIWILLLLILIVLVVIGILYRNKIKVQWYKWKGRASSTEVKRPANPGFGMPRFVPQQGLRRQPLMRQSPRPIRRTEKDTELEETMKKLRDMGK